MPGLQLYQTEVDELALVRAALDRDCCIVPDHHYKTAEAERLSDIDAFLEARKITRHFHVLSRSLRDGPLSMQKVSNERETFYYISPNVLTPSLEFLGGGMVSPRELNAGVIRSGFLEFSREYWSADQSRKMKSPPELGVLFDELSKAVKARSVRIKPGKSVFWLGRDAKIQLEKGACLVGFETWSFHRS